MSKIFTSKEFIDIFKHIVTLPTVYYSGGDLWSSWNGSHWRFDCVVSIKSVLWGWCEDKNAKHGGADYKSNGVPDFTTYGGLDYCTDVSQDFSKVVAGEYLCMAGTQYSHAGVCITPATKDTLGTAFEATTSWGVNRCVISQFDIYGNRYYNGVKNVPWTYHGKLNYIDYSDEPEPTPTLKYKVGDWVEINGVYVSSTSTEKLNPAITAGTITLVIPDAPNPYLLDDGNIGWVNDGCIITPPEPPTPTDYKELYEKEVEKNKELEKEIDLLTKEKATLQDKIDKAIKDLS